MGIGGDARDAGDTEVEGWGVVEKRKHETSKAGIHVHGNIELESQLADGLDVVYGSEGKVRG